MNPRLRAALLARRRKRGVAGGETPHPRRGDGYEFAELREYEAGDDPRRIDWAATARAGEVQTRVMFEDHALVLAGALDASRSMFVGRDRSLYAIAHDALETWYALGAADDRCARILPDTAIADARRRGRSAAQLCSSLRDEEGSSFERTLRIACAAVPRDALLLIVSDFYDLEAQAPLLRALAVRCDCTALLARDPWSSGLPLGGFVRLRDAESGSVRRVYIGKRERAAFAAAVAEREARVLSSLASMGMRCGVLERDPERALLEAFGVA